MPSIADLDRLLRRLDGKGYGAGKQVVGRYFDSDMLLWFTYAPADKFAPPGRLIVEFKPTDYGYPSDTLSDDTRRVCLAHFLSGLVEKRLSQEGMRLLRMDAPRQAVLRRTSVHVEPSKIQLRLGFHYEAAGRRILGHRCAEVYCERLPSLVRSIAYRHINEKALNDLIRCVENQRAIRDLLPELGLVGFVGDGSILPRQGNTDQPLGEGAVPFEAPESLEVSVPVAHGEDVRGLGIAEGRLTCISGANFQGKTTLLEALGQGVYDHVPGDGRELVVCLRDLAFANKENKRVVMATDITPFITSLPGVDDCTRFTSSASSGSTSQAACIMDAVEAGVPGILIDEDDSAVNLLVKDNRLKRLVPGDIEPIRPLIDTVKSLPREHGITPVMVVGALGEFTEIADTIVMMHEFKVEDATHRISEFRSDPTIELMQEVSERLPQDAKEELGRAKQSAREAQLRGRQFGSVSVRRPRTTGMGGRIKVRQMGRDEITISVDRRKTTIDLRGDIQKTLVEDSQVRALGDAVVHATRYMDGQRTLAEVVQCVCSDLEERGLDCLSRHSTPGQRDYAEFTAYQLFYVLSRYPAIRV